MIKLMSNLPANTVGIAASGRVSAMDYEMVLIPAVEAAFRSHDKIRLLYKLESDFGSFTPGAMWDDLKLGASHLRAWEKIAIVADVNWVIVAANMFKFIVPCPVKVFAIKEQSVAEQWVAA